MKVLKVMGEVTGRMDMTEFAEKTGLSSNETMLQMQELAKGGFVKKVGRGYAITEKGKSAIKAVTALPWNMRFNFYLEVGQPAGVSAGSVKEFAEIASRVNDVSLEFHFNRADFENWFKTTVKDEAFVEKLVDLKNSGLKGDALRKALLESLAERYSL